MARKLSDNNDKKINNTKKKSATKEKKTLNFEVISIFVIATCIFVGISFFTEATGFLGKVFKNLAMGLFGMSAYVICFFILFCALGFVLKRKFTKNKGRYTLTWILVVVFSTFWHILSRIENPEKITDFWYMGISGEGGGFVGGVLSIPLVSLCSFWGSVIILSAMIITLIITIFDISIFELVAKVRENIDERINNTQMYEEDEYVSRTAQQNMNSAMRKDLNKIKKQIFDFEKEFAETADNKNKIKSKNNSKKQTIDSEYSETKYNPNDILPDMCTPVEDDKQQVFGGVRNDGIGEEFDYESQNDEKKFDLVEEMEKTQSEVQATQSPDQDEIDKAIEIATEVALLPKKKKKEEVTQVLEIEIEAEEEADYKFPSINILREGEVQTQSAQEALERTARKLIDTLKSFGVEAKIVDYSRGPTITRYELQPGPGVKISKITNLADDIALNLGAVGIRIEPIAGKTAIGIEVPNEISSAVYIREVLGTNDFINFQSKLAFALGKDIAGNPVVGDIARMPHLLIAGSTGSGKSVCINTLITSILYKAKPNEVKLVMVDPKVVELGVYNGVPHLLIPVVTDPRKAAGALQWAVNEMTNRYKLFADTNVRDLKGYNSWAKENDKEELPQIVIIIDELADLMMVAPNDVEDSICRLAQMARAAGMHLVIATQRPSVDVITGIIKANIPSRIAFAVSSYVDSKTILDMGGAEKLLGRGDMLYYPIGASKPIRVQGAFVSDKEVENIVEFTKNQNEVLYDEDVLEQIENAGEKPQAHDEERGGDADELLPQAVEMAIDAGQASVAMYQRRLKIGYQRAARLIDQMESRGIIGPFDGTKPREVKITKAQWQEMFLNVNIENDYDNEEQDV